MIPSDDDLMIGGFHKHKGFLRGWDEYEMCCTDYECGYLASVWIN